MKKLLINKENPNGIYVDFTAEELAQRETDIQNAATEKTTEAAERENLNNTYVTLTKDVDYYVDGSTDSIYRVNSDGSAKNWPRGPGSVKINYNAGYRLCPVDLKLAVIDLITYYHKDEHKTRQTIAGASIQNQSSTSQRNNVAFPDHIKRVLDLYKTY